MAIWYAAVSIGFIKDRKEGLDQFVQELIGSKKMIELYVWFSKLCLVCLSTWMSISVVRSTQKWIVVRPLRILSFLMVFCVFVSVLLYGSSFLWTILVAELLCMMMFLLTSHHLL